VNINPYMEPTGDCPVVADLKYEACENVRARGLLTNVVLDQWQLRDLVDAIAEPFIKQMDRSHNDAVHEASEMVYGEASRIIGDAITYGTRLMRREVEEALDKIKVGVPE
jgi:hypothetical protein